MDNLPATDQRSTEPPKDGTLQPAAESPLSSWLKDGACLLSLQLTKKLNKHIGERIDAARAKLSSEGDGYFLQPNGTFCPPTTPYTEVEPYTPRTRQITNQRVVIVNGLNCTHQMINEWAQDFADFSGAPTVPVYNLSKGTFIDVLQAIRDRTASTSNPAIRSITALATDAIVQGTRLHLAGHSQGALIIYSALTNAIHDLETSGTLTRARIDWGLSNITVETFGGAAPYYPDGPRYIHYGNTGDLIAWHCGVTRFGVKEETWSDIEQHHIIAPPMTKSTFAQISKVKLPQQKAHFHPGADAHVIVIPNETRADWLDAHIVRRYLEQRKHPDSLTPETQVKVGKILNRSGRASSKDEGAKPSWNLPDYASLFKKLSKRVKPPKEG